MDKLIHYFEGLHAEFVKEKASMDSLCDEDED